MSTVSFGEPGLSPGQFSYPRAMDHDGTSLWVIDKSARVQRLDPKTGQGILGWRMPDWKLGKPTGVTVWRPTGGSDDDQYVFVADTHYHRVMVYRVGDHAGSPNLPPASDGPPWGAKVSLVGCFGEYGTGPGHFTYPTDVAVLAAPDGRSILRLYVSEYGGADRISAYEPGPDGTWVFKFSFGRFGSGSSPDQIEFSRPQSVEIDANRSELVVTDACNHRVGRFTLDGKLVAWFGGPGRMGDAPGEFTYPYGLCLLGDGTAMVAEFGNNRVQRIDLETGQSLGTFGQAGREPGQLATPWAVTVLGDAAYVLDSGNNRVLGFEKPTGGVRSALRGGGGIP